MTTTAHGIDKPLSYATAPRFTDSNGVERIEPNAALALALRIAEREKEVLDRLADK